jgi:hypothetical protein
VAGDELPLRVDSGRTGCRQVGHRLVSFSHWKPEHRWTFVNKNGKDKETLTFHPYLAMNDFAGLAPALRAEGGIGVGELPPVVHQVSFAMGGSSRRYFKPEIGKSAAPSSEPLAPLKSNS